LNYIEVPVLLRLNGNAMAGGGRVYALGGGYVAFKGSCNIEFGGQSESCEDVGADIKSTDYGAAVGVGVEWSAGGRKWSLSGRYDWGLAKIAEDEDIKTRSIAFVLGLSW